MSSASEGQSKRMRMKAFLMHSPASAASSAGSGAALSLVAPLRASQGHCITHIVGTSTSEMRSGPRNPSWHLFLVYATFLIFVCCSFTPFYHRSYFSSKVLHFLWFSIDGWVKKSSQQLKETRDLWMWEEFETTSYCVLWKLKGGSLKFRGLSLARESHYVHLWEEGPFWWKILKKKIENCYLTLIRHINVA